MNDNIELVEAVLQELPFLLKKAVCEVVVDSERFATITS